MAKGKSDKSDNGSDKPIVAVDPTNAKDDNGNSGEPIAAVDPTELPGGTGNFGNRYVRDDSGNIVYNADGSPKRKPGRKPGKSGTGKSKPKTDAGKETNNSVKEKPDLNSVAQMLVVIHSVVAMGVGSDIWEIDDQEGKLLAKAGIDFAAEFNVEIDPKVAASIGLIGAMGKVYSPRFMAFGIERARKKADAKKEKEKEPLDIPPLKSAKANGTKKAVQEKIDFSHFNMAG